MSKTYELTISKQYVHKWGVNEAIREIMQNAIDSERDGNELSINYNSGRLTIANYGCDIDASMLVLGSSEKQDGGYIGKFGEGFKLALIALLRNNIDVNIYTNGQKWTPEFRMSENFGIETMHVDVDDDEEYEAGLVSFEIIGLNYETFTEIRERHIAILRNMGHGIGDIEESEYGEILIDKRYKGMMFVDGLFIQEDSTFDYGYNFENEYVDLDRDRKAINYYELKELTALALSSQENFRLIHDSISSSSSDASNLGSAVSSMTKEFTENFSRDYLKNHNITEKTFVGTKKQVMIHGGKDVLVAPEVVGKILAKGLDKEEEYAVVNNKYNNLSNIEKGWEHYNKSKLKTLIDLGKRIKHKLSNEDFSDFMDIVRNWGYMSCFSYIEDDVYEDLKEYVKEETEDGIQE